LPGFRVGIRESAQNWRELLVDLKAGGLSIAPESATGDGALGFRKALNEVSPTIRHQRCTVHKTANMFDRLPKSIQPAARPDLREIWKATDRTTAEAATMTSADKHGAKYDKAVTCPVEDRDALPTSFTTSPPSTGIICGHQTRSRACSPRCGIGRCGPTARRPRTPLG